MSDFSVVGLFLAARLPVVGCLSGAGGHMSGIPRHYARFAQSGWFHSQKPRITTCQSGADARAAQQSTRSALCSATRQHPRRDLNLMNQHMHVLLINANALGLFQRSL